MTVAELIEKLAEFPPELDVFIGDQHLGPLEVYDVLKEEIEKGEWFENKFVGYKKVEVITLWR